MKNKISGNSKNEKYLLEIMNIVPQKTKMKFSVEQRSNCGIHLEIRHRISEQIGKWKIVWNSGCYVMKINEKKEREGGVKVGINVKEVKI